MGVNSLSATQGKAGTAGIGMMAGLNQGDALGVGQHKTAWGRGRLCVSKVGGGDIPLGIHGDGFAGLIDCQREARGSVAVMDAGSGERRRWKDECVVDGSVSGLVVGGRHEYGQAASVGGSRDGGRGGRAVTC